jgi:hypothetical protein
MAYLISWECVAAAAVLLSTLLMTVWNLRLTLTALFMLNFKTIRGSPSAAEKNLTGSAQAAKTFSIPVR